jgi:hypothetical protein
MTNATADQRLLQEILIEQDPSGWRMLVGCMLLNQTSRTQVDKVWPELFESMPRPIDVVTWSNEPWFTELLSSLGLQNRRRQLILKFSQWWLDEYNEAFDEKILAFEPPGVGEYAADSWRIFKMGPTEENCRLLVQNMNSWPRDKELEKWMDPVKDHIIQSGNYVDAAERGWRWQLDHPGGYISAEEMQMMNDYASETHE